MILADSHCHLDLPPLSTEVDDVLHRARAGGVRYCLCVAVNLEDFPRVLSLARNQTDVFASVGVHPDYPDVQEPDVPTLVRLAADKHVRAIGETGLDYFRQTEGLDRQRDRFRCHIRAARAAGKPLIIHTRAAKADTLAIMQEERADETGGVMHCFTEDWDTARAALDLGFYISFSGILTFRNADSLRDVARRVPADRMLIETDSPYLAPVPYRGKTNEPAFVVHVAETLARERGMSVEAVAETTTDNFRRLFRVI